MRSRNLKPSFFKNEKLGECDPLARILFEGLWCFADREGRFEWRSKLIKVEVLPYDNCDVEALLEQLCDAGLIVRYEIQGTPYGYVPKFSKHQKPHVREAESTLPAPENQVQGATKVQPRHDLGTTKEGSRHSQDVLNPESLLLIADSGSPLPDTGYRLEEHPPYPPQGGADPGKTGITYPEDFQRWWARYPKKTGKEGAFKCWKDPKKRNRRPPIDVCLEKLDEQIQSEDWTKEDGQYIPKPSTYINEGMWFDEVRKVHPLKGVVSEKTIRNIDNLNRWMQEETARER